MPKLIALISKQESISREAFRNYYEAHHAPLVSRLLPMVARYTRSYLPEEPRVPGDRGDANFDVLTELWFESENDLAAFWQRIREPDVAAAIRTDEANFLISERTQMYEVDEWATS